MQGRMEIKILPLKVSPAVSKIYEQKEGIEANVLLMVGMWLFACIYLTYSMHPGNLYY